jgi:hypothetical protein
MDWGQSPRAEEKKKRRRGRQEEGKSEGQGL